MMDHGGNIYQAARALGADWNEILDFSASINPLGPSPLARKVLANSVERVVHYPDPKSDSLREAISEYHPVPKENILVGNGSAELISLVGGLFEHQTALIPQPAFSEYAKEVVKGRGKVIEVPAAAPSFQIDLGSLLSEADPPARGVFLCNPNNPTGRLFSRKEVADFVSASGKRGVLVVLDEAFIDYHEEESLIRDSARFGNLIILRSFTKFFALPGLRVGYAVADPSTIDRLWRAQTPWSVNTLAQAAAIESLKDSDHIQRSRAWMKEEREWFYDRLSEIGGFHPIRPNANFILVGVPESISSTDLQKKLLWEKILVRDCATFPGMRDRFIRLAVRTRPENERLLSILKTILS